jgi:hypothetical protein
MNIKDLLTELDDCFNRLLFARSMTPYIDRNNWKVEKDSDYIFIETTNYYRGHGFDAQLFISNKRVKYKDWYDTGSWINKSFFVYMYSILDQYAITKLLNKKLKNESGREKDAWDLFVNLRHSFVHSAKINKGKKEETKANQNLALELQKKLYPLLVGIGEDICLNIDDFIEPFYLEIRDILINRLSKYVSFKSMPNGDFEGKIIIS